MKIWIESCVRCMNIINGCIGMKYESKEHEETVEDMK